MDEENEIESFQDQYDEDYITTFETDSGDIRIEITSHDGLGITTTKFVDLATEDAQAFAGAITTMSADISPQKLKAIADIRRRDSERREAEVQGVTGGMRESFDIAFLLDYIDILEGNK